MNTIRKHLGVVLMILLFLPSALHAEGSQLSIPKVAQSILEADGYRFFTFTTDDPVPLLLTATLDDQSIEIMEIRASKEVVLAIKLGKENILQAIHAYYVGGSETHSFGSGYGDLTFTTVSFSNPIELAKPFMTLRSPNHSIAFQVTKK